MKTNLMFFLSVLFFGLFLSCNDECAETVVAGFEARVKVRLNITDRDATGNVFAVNDELILITGQKQYCNGKFGDKLDCEVQTNNAGFAECPLTFTFDIGNELDVVNFIIGIGGYPDINLPTLTYEQLYAVTTYIYDLEYNLADQFR